MAPLFTGLVNIRVADAGERNVNDDVVRARIATLDGAAAPDALLFDALAGAFRELEDEAP